MILEYFYVERPLGSDGFFDNRLIAANNILTTLEIVMLILATLDMVADNLIDTKDRRLIEAKGVGTPDGRIDMFEFLIIIDTLCIAAAGIIRLVVNSQDGLNWDENLVNNMLDGRGCLKFNWNTEVFGSIDIIYLVLCCIPLASIVFVFWSIFAESFFLSKIIIFKNKKSDEHLWNSFFPPSFQDLPPFPHHFKK